MMMMMMMIMIMVMIMMMFRCVRVLGAHPGPAHGGGRPHRLHDVQQGGVQRKYQVEDDDYVDDEDDDDDVQVPG